MNQVKRIITAFPVAFLLFAKMQTPRFSPRLTSPLSLRDKGVGTPPYFSTEKQGGKKSKYQMIK
jgi:hypothetical protein